MKALSGIVAANGICKGTVCMYLDRVEETIPHYEISDAQIAREIKRFEKALAHAQEEMQEVIEKARSLFDEQNVQIFQLHLMFLKNEGLKQKVVDIIKSRHVNAEHAVQDAFEYYIKQFVTKEAHFAELAHDYVDTRNRIILALSGEISGTFKCEIGEQGPVVVATNRLTPSLVLSIPKEHVLAFVAKEGGITSHATIIARSYNVPIIFGIDVEKELDCGLAVIVDGSQGKIILEPDEKTTTYYDKKLATIARKKSVCEIKKDDGVKTKTGKRVYLKVNISTPEEIRLLEDIPHDGIGLLRTEFLFMRRSEPPTEDEQFEMYKKVVEAGASQPVTIRLLDISSDKLPSYITLPPNIELDLTLRGALAVEAFSSIFMTQMKALLRASTAGIVQVLYPMVSDIEDLNTYRAIFERAKNMLRKEGKKISQKRIKEGIMIETPAAVMLAGDLLRLVDFVNIGSNDLLQYTLAAARGNTVIEERYHILHPALAKMLAIIVAAGRKEKKEVCLCGEIASFEEFYPILLSLGLRSFSVAVSKFSDIKCELLHQHMSKHKGELTKYLKVRTKKEADRYFSKFL